MPDFFEQYARLLTLALETGVRSVIIPRDSSGHPFFDPRLRRKFLSSCHRGFEKSQNRIVRLLCELEENTELPPDEKEYRELLLRKIVDGIATTMLQDKAHVARRLALHNEIPGISMPVVKEALSAANKLNSESRQTFALVADLTTFVHVTDLVRVDFRGYQPSVSLIELKSGCVNQVLLEHLEQYAPQEESLQLIQEDPSIEEKHRAQAKRMLRQRIRLAQIDEVLTTDKGTDIQFNMPIILSKEEIVTESYDHFLDQLCDGAKSQVYAAGIVSSCIHVGVGFSKDKGDARTRAIDALGHAIRSHLVDPPDGFAEVWDEVTSMVPHNELFKTFDILHSNLYAVPCKPLVSWSISRDNLISLVTKELCILVSFDVSSFIWLARQLGLEVSLTSRKRATQEAQRLGSLTVPRWGNRGIEYMTPEGPVLLLSGFFSRFINDLVNPLPFLKQIHEDRKSFGANHATRDQKD